ALDDGSQIIETDDVSAGSLGFFSLRTLGEHGDAPSLAGTCRQNHGAAHQLVGLLGIDAEGHGHVDGLIELGGGVLLDQRQRIGQRVELVAINGGASGLGTLGKLSHDYRPSTVMPMLRAEPAMVRTAASRSAAVKSFCLVLAISSAWALVILPTLSVCGLAEPLVRPAAFLIRIVAGGVFMMKVKDLSAKAVITAGIGRPGSRPCVWALNALQNSMMLRPR